MTTIIGIKISNRLDRAMEVQEVLTRYGCIIKTRIGLHEEKNGVCSPKGIVLLEIINDESAIDVEKELCDIEDIEIQQMRF